MHKTLHLKDGRRQIVYQEKEQVDLLSFNIVSIHRYNNYKTTYKSVEIDWLQRLETIPKNKNNQKTKMEIKTIERSFQAANNQNLKQENFSGWETEAFREKLIFFW